MSKHVLQLDSTPAWKPRPGSRILVIDNGAIRFEFPTDWTMSVDEKHVRFTRRPPPNDSCALILSTRLTSPRAAVIPLKFFLDDIVSTDARPVTYRGPAIQLFRPPMEAAWIQMQFHNPADGRNTCSRVCLARAGCTLAIIVFDSLPEDELALYGIWNRFLETLMVGEYFADPVTGRRREQWG